MAGSTVMLAPAEAYALWAASYPPHAHTKPPLPW